MNKIQEFTNAERQKYGDLYGKLVMKQSEASSLLSQDEMRKRFYVHNLPKLKQYLDMLDEADRKANGSGLLEIFKSDDKYKEEVLEFKATILDTIDKLALCLECKCSNCSSICNFNSCLNCRVSESTRVCSEDDEYYLKSSSRVLKLWSNDEKRNVTFNVKAIIEDAHSEGTYYYLIEDGNRDNQHILEYIKESNGKEEFLPVENTTLLDELFQFFVKSGAENY